VRGGGGGAGRDSRRGDKISDVLEIQSEVGLRVNSIVLIAPQLAWGQGLGAGAGATCSKGKIGQRDQ
jgi:hypothetical protein